MFERLCYYGMRGLLVLYLTKALLQGDTQAYLTYGAYTAMVYAAPVWGGKLADTVLGYKRAIMFGGIVMAIGEFLILGGNEFWLFLGMSAIIIGNGYFKANISTVVGKLYKDGDPRRDSGFTIFYMGINIGALLATLVVSPLGEKIGFHWGFALAGVGMLVGVAIFFFGQDKLDGHGEPPSMEIYKKYGMIVYAVSLLAIPALFALIKFGPGIIFLGQNLLFYILLGLLLFVCFNLLRGGFQGGAVARDRILVLMILMTFNVVFWAFFEQAGSSLTLFTDRNVDRYIPFLDWEMGAAMTQSFNSMFILLFGSVFSAMWIALERRNANPNIPAKFGIGILLLGIGFLVLLLGREMAGPDALVPLWILAFMYMLHTMGELSLSPIGLSMVTKLSPPGMTGTVMGAWFLSWAGSNYVAAILAKLTGSEEEGSAAIAGMVRAAENAIAVPPGPVTKVLAVAQERSTDAYWLGELGKAQEGLTTYVDLFATLGYIAFGTGVFLIIIARPLNRMMHGVK
jgi:POT family proton-dependent oligopeptide transporter